MTSTMSSERQFPEFHLGDRLRKAREAADLGQQELCQRIDISHVTMRKYERGISTPREHVIIAWALATGFTVEQLKGEDSPKPGPGGTRVSRKEQGTGIPSGQGKQQTRWYERQGARTAKAA